MTLGPGELAAVLGVVFVLALVVVMVAVIVARRTRRQDVGVAEAGPMRIEEARIALEIDDADPSDPAVQRLAHDAAAHAFASRPDLEYVDITTRTGKMIARIQRKAPTGDVQVPPGLLEPHASTRHRPEPVERAAPSGAAARFTDQAPGPHRSLAESFDLPESVRSRLRNPNDTVELVKAICEAGGIDIEVDGNVIRAGDEVLIVIGSSLGHVIDAEDLNQAFFAFQQSGARRGVVVTPGLMYPDDLRRRQTMAPMLSHAGPEGIQRMADAVGLGGNPMRFVVGPAVASD